MMLHIFKLIHHTYLPTSFSLQKPRYLLVCSILAWISFRCNIVRSIALFECIPKDAHRLIIDITQKVKYFILFPCFICLIHVNHGYNSWYSHLSVHILGIYTNIEQIIITLVSSKKMHYRIKPFFCLLKLVSLPLAFLENDITLFTKQTLLQSSETHFEQSFNKFAE